MTKLLFESNPMAHMRNIEGPTPTPRTLNRGTWLTRLEALLPLICLVSAAVTATSIVISAIELRANPLATNIWILVSFASSLATIGFASFESFQSANRAKYVQQLTSDVKRQAQSGFIDETKRGDAVGGLGDLAKALGELGKSHDEAVGNLSKRADQLATIDTIVTTINRTLDLQEVLDTSLHEVLQAVNLEVGALYMWDDRSGTLNMVSYLGMTEDAVRKNISYRLGEGFIGKSAQQQSIVMAYPGQAGTSGDLHPDDGWPATQISIPLVAVPGQLLGTLIMGTGDPRTLSIDDMALLMTVSAQIALAIDKAQLYTKASEHAVELENIVAARTEQLSQAIDELWIALKQAREADRIKSLLLSTVSHELRTPLATIKGSATLLIEHHSQIRASQRLEHLRDIDDEADKLTELISSLLDMSRIEAGTLQISVHPFNLVAVVKESAERARVRFQDRRLKVRSNKSSVMCSGDIRRTEQVVGNLIDNAWKYSESGTSIELGVTSTNSEAIVSVNDRGIGIDKEHMTHIFDRFYQVSMSSDSARRGIGLGLAICKGLVEAQGGRIWAESELRVGSTFSFSLPLYESETGG